MKFNRLFCIFGTRRVETTASTHKIAQAKLVRSNNGGQKISIFQEVELKLEVRKLNAFREEVVLTLMGVDDLVDERKTPPKKRRRR